MTITDKKTSGNTFINALNVTSNCELKNNYLRESTSLEKNILESENERIEMGNNNLNIITPKNQNIATEACQQSSINITKVDNESNLLNASEQLIKFDESTIVEQPINHNEDISKAKLMNSMELQNTNNAQNRRKIDMENNFGKTVYFEEIIVDGKKEKVGDIRKNESSLLGDLPPLAPKSNSIFSDLPPLNGKKTNINDLKELMDIGLSMLYLFNYINLP